MALTAKLDVRPIDTGMVLKDRTYLALKEAIESTGNSVEAVPCENRNHFEMGSEFAVPDSPLFKAVISQISR